MYTHAITTQPVNLQFIKLVVKYWFYLMCLIDADIHYLETFVLPEERVAVIDC